ncbi:MAG: TIGR04086 family membrane protein [Oscillospiraceae bacterium]|nr:TIGR04086 family membrane protein [Oscillospiraceae bacterium]
MHHVRVWKSVLYRYLFSVLEGVFCIFAGGLGIAFLLTAGTLPARVLVWMMHFLWSSGAFFASKRAGFHGRRHGICTGFVCSLFLSLFLFAGCVFLKEAVTARMFTRCLLMFPAGIAGGIAGVNQKLRKPPY